METKGKIDYSFLFKPLFFVFCLIAGSALVLYIEKLRPSDLAPHEGLFKKDNAIEISDNYPLRTEKGLNEHQKRMATIAWNYFEKNYSSENGLVPSLENGKTISFKDFGDYMMAIVSAFELRLIEKDEFEFKIKKFIETLDCLPVSNLKIPYSSYNIETLVPIKETNEPIAKAEDIARFFAAVNKIGANYPYFLTEMKVVLGKWELNKLLFNGSLISLNLQNGVESREHTSRLGYEEYCAKCMSIQGFDLSESSKYEDYLKFVNYNNIKIAVDEREEVGKPLKAYITSEPYILDGLEYGWDINSRELAYRVFLAQKERFKETGIVTTASEDPIDEYPFYVYNSLYADHRLWNTFDRFQENPEGKRIISSKVAIGWFVLFADPYSDHLYNKVKDLAIPGRGWMVGKYEKTDQPVKVINIATNGMILEALCYKKNGKIIHF